MEIIPFEERYRQAFIDFNTAWNRDAQASVKSGTVRYVPTVPLSR